MDKMIGWITLNQNLGSMGKRPLHVQPCQIGPLIPTTLGTELWVVGFPNPFHVVEKVQDIQRKLRLTVDKSSG